MTKGLQEAVNQWEYFCDRSYYDMWAVRPSDEKRWGYCFHLSNNEEAEGLCSLLNSLTGASTRANDRLDEAVNLLQQACKDYVKEVVNDKINEAISLIQTAKRARGG